MGAPKVAVDLTVMVMMPGHNVADILPKTVSELPKGCADIVLLVNDGSSDGTDEVAKKLGVSVVSHEKSRGYGGAQKTGYKEAIRRGADIVVMVHGDDQYDPALAPKFIGKIKDEGYDVVTGSRMLLGDALKNGMPIWKYIPNRFLTWLENTVFQTNISDYHNGYRAFRTSFLKRVPLDLLSDRFDFDTDIMIQAAIRKQKIAEIPHATRYLDENSQMSFSKGVRYGLSILVTVSRYLLHRIGLWKQKLFMEQNA
jgi:glycosyltransferase involved in cell wall biosynthesis